MEEEQVINNNNISEKRTLQAQSTNKILGITHKAGILESVDVSDYLVYQDVEKKEIRGGPADALAVHASSKGSLLFQEAFITTFHGFIDAEELIKRLIRR